MHIMSYLVVNSVAYTEFDFTPSILHVTNVRVWLLVLLAVVLPLMASFVSEQSLKNGSDSICYLFQIYEHHDL